jgi:hypothetical protein
VGEDTPCGCVQDCPGANWENADLDAGGTADGGGSTFDGGIDICSLPAMEGPCNDDMLRFFFNDETGRCEPLYYGGCRGNANNFETIEHCQQTCGCPNALPLRCGDRLDHNTHTQGRSNMWRGYNCSQRLESGREAIYVFQQNESCKAVVRLNGMTTDLDLFLLDTCDPLACTTTRSPTPFKQFTPNVEKIAFQAEAGQSYFAVVDGYDGAAGAYSIEVDCLIGAFADDYADGEWVMQVDRQWDHATGNVQFPSDEIKEEYYQPVNDGDTYEVTVTAGWEKVAVDGWGNVVVGATSLSGVLTASSIDSSSRLTYDLTSGSMGGGRFVVWSGESGLQAELTIYGSGVPIISSERGALNPKL